MADDIREEITGLRQALADSTRADALAKAVAEHKTKYDKINLSLSAARASHQSLIDRIPELARERERRKHTGEYWPPFVIGSPLATFLIVAGFFLILLKFNLLWSICLSIPFVLLALIMAIALFYSRVEELIDAEQIQTEEKIRQLVPELKTLETEYNLQATLYNSVQNELKAETVRRNAISKKLQLLESKAINGLIGPANWRHLRGVEFEAFLKRIFEGLNYVVEMTPASHDYGVDLILDRDGFRIAVQAKGYDGVVTNSAVQEAHTGMSYHQCHRCAVITNSNFTRNAIELANRVGCRLIGESELDQLIRGEISIM